MNTRNAGYTIVKYEVYRTTKECENSIVLAKNEKTGMWVTWECTDGNNFFWGHYYDSKTEAYHNYYSRLASKYNRPWEED